MAGYQIISTSPTSAQAIMEKDHALLQGLDPEGHPILHLYEWASPAATYGYFLKPETILKTREGLDLARRPTGGGLLFHVTDFAFSVLLPASHLIDGGAIEQYRLVNRQVIQALERLFPDSYHLIDASLPADLDTYCMAKGTKYDVLVGSKKIVGAAQRTKKQGLLHQGTISLACPSEAFLMTYLPTKVAQEMLAFTHALCPIEEVAEVKQALKQALCEVFG